METIDRINNCKNDEQLYWLTKRLIKDAINESKSANKYKGLIGPKLEVNPTSYDLLAKEDINNKIVYSVDVWNGFIPKGTKLVYGSIINRINQTISSGGFYYYVDDESYIYDFIKFIKNYKIEDEFDVIAIVNKFEDKLFDKIINQKKREEIHGVLFKNDTTFCEPVRKHSIKDFYGNGRAQCTEYALVTNNLLSVLGIPVSYMNDRNHAFNVFYYEIADEKYDSYILDYSQSVSVFDEKLQFKYQFPFFKKIENGDKDFIDRVVNHGERIKMPDYDMIQINNTLFECKNGEERNYGVVERVYDEEKKLVLKK